jgi:hypothetical protein
MLLGYYSRGRRTEGPGCLVTPTCLRFRAGQHARPDLAVAAFGHAACRAVATTASLHRRVGPSARRAPSLARRLGLAGTTLLAILAALPRISAFTSSYASLLTFASLGRAPRQPLWSQAWSRWGLPSSTAKQLKTCPGMCQDT